MASTDTRSPGLVREAFHHRIATLLVPRGFEVRAKGNLVRRHGKNRHRVEFSSSHRNVEGSVTCCVYFGFEDGLVRARLPHWGAGGFLHGHVFDGDRPEANVADPPQADGLAELVVQRLSFFDLMENPKDVLAEVSRRYVPGIVEPSVIVPYLSARIGPEAAASYAGSLLQGRPELWPAFASAREQMGAPPSVQADHGTQLARALEAERIALSLPAGADVVRSADPSAAALRCFMGRQLRAWGEPEAAAALRSLSDSAIRDVHAAQKALDEPLVDSQAAAQLVLRAALGEDRAPRRRRPSPRLFQYFPLSEPFGLGSSPR